MRILALVGLLSLVSIGLVVLGGPALKHGIAVAHKAGIITAINPTGSDFTLKVDKGPALRFLCQDRCRFQLSHMQRHLTERAHTDVYFITGPGNVLIAMDVD
jgi:hypothetical protein